MIIPLTTIRETLPLGGMIEAISVVNEPSVGFSKHKGSEQLRFLRIKYRARTIAAFGGACCKCGFADARALQFDHIHGGGAADLKKNGMKPSNYNKILEDKEEYQLLCANCNWIKRHESNELRNVGAKTSVIMKRYWASVRAGTTPPRRAPTFRLPMPSLH